MNISAKIRIISGFSKYYVLLFCTFRKKKVIAEFVETEEFCTGMRATEVAADESTEKTMGETDEAQYQRNMDAFDEGNKTGIASQFIAELMEGAQALFGLADKVGVALEGTKSHRVVDMGDGDMVGTQLLAKEHIFVSIVTETLIEGVGEHEVTTDEEVGGVEVTIGILLAYLHRVLVF